MIAPQELRLEARRKGLPLDLVEKDYALGWILFGIASSSLSEHIAFKGGTALSKIYFPGRWRLSEDLDFTLTDEISLAEVVGELEEVPRKVENASGIAVTVRSKPFNNLNYVQSKLQFTGPISRNTVKIEFSKEGFVGEIVQRYVPQVFVDYPIFSVRVYSLENMLTEKMRALIERGKLRDYYDVWKMLKVETFDPSRVRELFRHKCSAKNVVFTGVDQLFPSDLSNTLKPYMKVGLTRLISEPLPQVETMLEELRLSLRRLLA